MNRTSDDPRPRSIEAGTEADAQYWAAWRRHFPLLEEAIFLNTSNQGARSDRVAAAFARYLDDWQLEAPWETTWRGVVADANAGFARLIGADDSEVVMVPTVTDAFHRTLSALRDQGRTRVVVSAREWVSLQHAVRAWRGIEPVFVAAEIHPDDDAFLAHIDERTGLVVVSHVCYRTGYRADLDRIAERAHAHGARVFVDAFQSAGVTPIDVAASRVDFLAAGALKFLLGSPGAAFLYVRAEVAAEARPTLTGWRGQRQAMVAELDPAAGAARFGAGTWPVPSAYAARAGLELLQEAGPKRIAARIERLVGRFQRALAARGVALVTPTDPARRGAVVVVPHHDGAALQAALRARGTIAAARDDGLRFSFHAYNTDAECDAVAQHLADLLEGGIHRA